MGGSWADSREGSQEVLGRFMGWVPEVVPWMSSHVVPGLFLGWVPRLFPGGSRVGSQAVLGQLLGWVPRQVPGWFPGSARDVPGLVFQGGFLRRFPGCSWAVPRPFLWQFPGAVSSLGWTAQPLWLQWCLCPAPSCPPSTSTPGPELGVAPHRQRCPGAGTQGAPGTCRAAGQQELRDTNRVFQRGSVLALHCSLTKCCTQSFAALHSLSKYHIHETCCGKRPGDTGDK